MIEPNGGSVWYVNKTKTGQKIGVKMGTKVFHFNATDDEEFEIGESLIVTVTRAD